MVPQSSACFDFRFVGFGLRLKCEPAPRQRELYPCRLLKSRSVGFPARAAQQVQGESRIRVSFEGLVGCFPQFQITEAEGTRAIRGAVFASSAPASPGEVDYACLLDDPLHPAFPRSFACRQALLASRVLRARAS